MKVSDKVINQYVENILFDLFPDDIKAQRLVRVEIRAIVRKVFKLQMEEIWGLSSVAKERSYLN